MSDASHNRFAEMTRTSLIVECQKSSAELASLKAQLEQARAIMTNLLCVHPAFRAKPVGAPSSPARYHQNNCIALEDDAKAWLALSSSPSGAVVEVPIDVARYCESVARAQDAVATAAALVAALRTRDEQGR
jgi:hypothetical protein